MHYHLQVQANPKKLHKKTDAIFYCSIVSIAKGNIAKSNKSELWNRLSYKYLFEVRRQKFRNDCQILRSQPQNLEAKCHSTSTTSKGLSENLKKMSWHNPVFPIDAKNSIGFFCAIFFWVSLDL